MPKVTVDSIETEVPQGATAGGGMKYLALTLAGLLAATPAPAQVEGSRLTKYADRADSAQVLDIWVNCVAGLDSKWARSVLDTIPTTSIEEKVLAKRTGDNDRCLEDSRLLMDGRSIAFSSDTMRGELARHYVNSTLAKSGRIAGGATGWLRDRLAALPPGEIYDRPKLVGHQFAACLADDHFVGTRALVTSVRGSVEQKTAFAALSPHFGSCLAAGAKLGLTVPILRLYLAEAVYHALTHTPMIAATGAAR